MLKPYSKLQKWFNNSGHKDTAKAFRDVQWWIEQYLLCSESDLHNSALELRKMLADLVDSWGNSWISIEDENELPPIRGDRVLVSTKDFGTTVGLFDPVKDEWMIMAPNGWLVYDRVISWLSIPD